MAVSAVKKEPAKPKQGEAAPAAEPAPAPAGKKGKKLLFILLGLLVVLAGGGGGAWWYLGKDAGKPATAKVEPEKPPVFAALDNFTVNLQNDDVSQFAQVGLTLRMSDDDAVAKLKLRMPEVRDRILLMLSVRKPAELLTIEGKRKLAEDIQASVNEILAPDAVKKAAAAAAAAKRAAAKTKEKPEPAAPSEPAEGQEGAQPEQAEAAAEAETPPAPVVLPVKAVLFTSFIIQ